MKTVLLSVHSIMTYLTFLRKVSAVLAFHYGKQAPVKKFDEVVQVLGRMLTQACDLDM